MICGARGGAVRVCMLVAMAVMGAELRAAETADREVVVLGASISQAWALDGFGERMPARPYRVRALVEYGFDKGSLVNSVLSAERRPDAVVIKECAAYFPGDLVRYRQMVEAWSRALAAAGVEPVLATVAPVTERLPTWIGLKQLVKRYVLLRDDYVDNERRLRGIWAYNDWVRDYARRENLALLDLEAALRVGPDARYLPAHLHSGDGLHLGDAAYRRMDKALLETLDSLFTKPGQRTGGS